MMSTDEHRMATAMTAAKEAASRGEVPIGACVISPDGELLATAFNLTITNSDPTAHAEILAIRSAAAAIGNYRLTGATVYSTLEPCVMCAGALLNARIGRLVFAAHDERFGAVETHFRVCDTQILNHRIEIESGLMAEDSRLLLQEFFRKRRGENKAARQNKSLT